MPFEFKKHNAACPSMDMYDPAFAEELTRRVKREHELAAKHVQLLRELAAPRPRHDPRPIP